MAASDPMPGYDTPNLEHHDRISKTKEILMRHGFATSAVPEIAKTFQVSLRTAYRYKAQAEREVEADIDLNDEEATQIFLEGVLEQFHAPGSKPAVRLKALDMLAKLKGLYRPQRIEVSTPLKDLPDESLRDVAEELGLDPSGEPPTPGPANAVPPTADAPEEPQAP